MRVIQTPPLHLRVYDRFCFCLTCPTSSSLSSSWRDQGAITPPPLHLRVYDSFCCRLMYTTPSSFSSSWRDQDANPLPPLHLRVYDSSCCRPMYTTPSSFSSSWRDKGAIHPPPLHLRVYDCFYYLFFLRRPRCGSSKHRLFISSFMITSVVVSVGRRSRCSLHPAEAKVRFLQTPPLHLRVDDCFPRTFRWLSLMRNR